ncbi:MAG: thioredoxin family protein [Actinomycetota bacterium]
MTRLIVLVVLVAVAVVVALVLQRRRPDPPSVPSYRAPAQLDRDDFDRPGDPFLVVVFASASCHTCPEVWAIVEPLGTDDLVVQRVDVEHRSELHERYRIDGVPTTVLANADGVVTATFFGPTSPDDLAEAVDALRRTASDQ